MPDENPTNDEHTKVADTTPADPAEPSTVEPSVTHDVAEEEAPATNAESTIEISEEERKQAVVLPNRDLRPGMVVRVHEVIKDVNAKGEERERVQIFEGTIMGISGKHIGRTMTVRKISKGYGVEKIYPLSSPHVAKVEVIKQMRVRRAKLHFLRHLFKRRLKERA